MEIKENSGNYIAFSPESLMDISNKDSDKINRNTHNGKAFVYGLLAGVGILIFYISVLTIFQSYGFALYEFKRLWFWLVPLAIGFGTQIGLYTSIRHDANVNGGMAASGTISGGSMIVCCSHYLLSVIPFIGITGLSAFTSFLMTYQKAFFSIGIASSIIGITLMLNHKRTMIGGSC